MAIDLNPTALASIGSGFPLKVVLSFGQVIDFWRKAAGGGSGTAPLAQQVLRSLEGAPELLGAVTDLSLVDKHKGVVDALMTAVFAPGSQDIDCGAAHLPFWHGPFYVTSCFERVMGRQGLQNSRYSLEYQTLEEGSLCQAYHLIGRTFYGLAVSFDYPLTLSGVDPATGLERHFRMIGDHTFVQAVRLGGPESLTAEQRSALIANPADMRLWMSILPPENFEIHGFSVGRAIDITENEIVSSLRRDLVENDSVVSKLHFQKVQQKLRAILRHPEIELGLAAIHGEHLFLLGHHLDDERCLVTGSHRFALSDLPETVFGQLLKDPKLTVIHDLEKYPTRPPIEAKLLGPRIRNVVLAPLSFQNQVIGIIVIKSPRPGDVNELNAVVLQEVLPLFSMAMQRSADELQARIQSVIKEKFTAIHPAVEWRFRKAAVDFIERRITSPQDEIDQVVFRDVFPLYGASDIRGSSIHRSASIQADLHQQLNLANDVILTALGANPLPFLDHLRRRLEAAIERIETEPDAEDEVSGQDLIQHEFEAVLDSLSTFGEATAQKVAVYRAAIDSKLGVLYRRRKDFDDSVTLINETVSSCLDEEQSKAQQMYPHYFEKHKSDGVEHGMYIGASLMEDGKFDPLFLKNLRLWQLMVTCRVARKAHQLKEQLKVQLDLTHIILVQSTPLSIRFRADERQFDVDGAYNIRYEIMKKRIDKATVRGKDERLTQPGMLAIIYSHVRERAEYLEYIDWLRSSGFVEAAIEELDIEPLQGVHGLKALRVPVRLQEGPQRRLAAGPEEEAAALAPSNR